MARRIVDEIDSLEKEYIKNKDEVEIIPYDVSRNRAFYENFVTVLFCNRLKIPVLVVGKPGSSKTLAV